VVSIDKVAFFISQGNFVANRQTFPSGIKALTDYVHAKGLKLGIYSDAGYASYQIYHYMKTNLL
jgi:alpha-galactosidase